MQCPLVANVLCMIFVTIDKPGRQPRDATFFSNDLLTLMWMSVNG